METPILPGPARELAGVTAASTGHRPGQRGVVPTGDAGIGKSGLLSTVSAQFIERGAMVLRGGRIQDSSRESLPSGVMQNLHRELVWLANDRVVVRESRPRCPGR